MNKTLVVRATGSYRVNYSMAQLEGSSALLATWLPKLGPGVQASTLELSETKPLIENEFLLQLAVTDTAADGKVLSTAVRLSAAAEYLVDEWHPPLLNITAEARLS